VMAKAVINSMPGEDFLFCPMIDARRMEVFTAVYDPHLKKVMEPQALILDENSFSHDFPQKTIIFSGNGAKKWQNLTKSSNFKFSEEVSSAAHLHQLASIFYSNNQFADLAYVEPIYLKPFFSPSHKP